MTGLRTQGGASASPPFDAATWLHALADAGFVYAVDDGGKLWVGAHEGSDTSRIRNLMGDFRVDPAREIAVAAYLVRRQCGEVA